MLATGQQVEVGGDVGLAFRPISLVTDQPGALAATGVEKAAEAPVSGGIDQFSRQGFVVPAHDTTLCYVYYQPVMVILQGDRIGGTVGDSGRVGAFAGRLNRA
jgi:hypothetical protein